MMIRPKRFNLYFAVMLAGLLAGGCTTPAKERKDQATKLEMHLEVSRESTNLSEPVPIFREKPVMVNVEKEAFLTELNVADAKVVELPGGFAIQLHFDRKGTWLLEEYTNENHGKRVAIRCIFGPELKETRWLAAPKIVKGITDGYFTFTPDATREEADIIVLGLNNVGREVQKASPVKLRTLPVAVGSLLQARFF